MDNLLEVRKLTKYFSVPGGQLHAVDGVSFSLEAGKTLGIVGESGCGKSTLGRVVLGLLDATDGQILYKGQDITHVDRKRRKALRREMQMVFQDPFSSLNPRMCVYDLIAEPMRINHICNSKDELERRVAEIMDTVGLAARLASSYPHELDGGRRQRIGIARALGLSPSFIVCDEPVSALDVSIQAQILNLLKQLQKEKGITYIFITHDLSVVKHISDEILVMYLGCVVEKCGYKELFENNYHPYTKGLLSAIPIPEAGGKRRVREIMQGELTSPINPGNGCRFCSRCKYADDRCKQEMPELREICEEHFVACHHAEKINSK